jgi:hypothetical protein
MNPKLRQYDEEVKPSSNTCRSQLHLTSAGTPAPNGEQHVDDKGVAAPGVTTGNFYFLYGLFSRLVHSFAVYSFHSRTPSHLHSTAILIQNTAEYRFLLSMATRTASHSLALQHRYYTSTTALRSLRGGTISSIRT